MCGDCGASWEATKIHGDAKAPVERSTLTPIPLHPGNVVRLPVRWGWQQPELFDAATFRVEKVRPKCSRKRRRREPSRFEQLVLPEVVAVVVFVPRQARTKPTAPAVAA